MSLSVVQQTAQISLFIQLITGILSSHGLFITLNIKDKILTHILQLETFVQFIEFVFYTWMTFSFSFSNSTVTSLAAVRYIDWFVTTPIMLLSTLGFLQYKQYKKLNKTLTFSDFLKNNDEKIKKMFLFNFLMLLFGLLGELNILPLHISTLIGFYFFIETFKILKTSRHETNIGSNLYSFMFIIWSLYGFAALLPVYSKNIFYNGLDVFSKNFYGLFIYVFILKIHYKI